MSPPLDTMKLATAWTSVFADTFPLLLSVYLELTAGSYVSGSLSKSSQTAFSRELVILHSPPATYESFYFFEILSTFIFLVLIVVKLHRKCTILIILSVQFRKC